ncbi:Hsp20/alpha crystallin family protein [Pigmentiphaga litoralis]|uniref:HSP20 family protein n=1 Tax=Pigmentiphaga litoralis TaxID=516702 RepID=A0A7Y9IWK1_9BURK|nr:Hsp20/alpha crystallin family protein [Pigmentiphaga litoralis]NYE22255.1 HSP20 family protein [Pigmentiphaga litoralis]NYE84130.1 HSP20 family protein [Pigmentiphaga litoralis]
MATLTSARDFASDFEAIRSQMDDIFRSLGVSSDIRAYSRGFPSLNIGSTPDAVELVAFVPGVDAASLQVTIDKGLLTIAGERQSAIPRDVAGLNVYAQERRHGAFRRVVELPQDADPDAVDASYVDGCLRITVRKRESSKPRLIPVQ